jgi:CelD/BcsL family acetyltransferase involved in cellulose biosynthesis
MEVEVALFPLPDRETLAAWWRELDAEADCTFFTSWTWIGVWLHLLPDVTAAQVVVAMRGDERVGLGIVVQSRTRLLKAFRVRAWRLHTAGVRELDDLAIEYNDFLAQRSDSGKIRLAMLQWLAHRAPKGVIEIRGASGPVRSLAEHPPAGLVARHQERTSHLVSLNAVRAADGGYLSLLGSNVRSQIRRSMKAYAARGPLRVDAATQPDQAFDYFDKLRALHSRRFSALGVESQFARDAAREFHRRVIEEGLPRGEVQLLRLSAGDADIGYLYNFVHRGTVSYYQSGLDFDLLEKHGRPGLVGHAMAIEHNAALGHTWYDLLAGDYRYKASLATDQLPQAHCVFSRETPLALMDAYARRLVDARRKRKLQAATEPTEGAAQA